MTALSAAIRRLAGRTFRDRQIIIRTESGVVAKTLRRHHQALALGLAFAMIVWVVASTVALVAAGNGLLQREARIAALQQERARVAADLTARNAELAEIDERDRNAVAVLADLNQQLGFLERELERDRRLLADLTEERSTLARDLAAQRTAFSDIAEERDRLATQTDNRTVEITALSGERSRLAAELSETRQALIEAQSWNASVGNGFAQLGSTVYEAARLVFAGDEPSGLVLALDAAERTIDTLRAERIAFIEGSSQLVAARDRAQDERATALAALGRAEAALAQSEAVRRTAEHQLRASLHHAAMLWQQGNERSDALGALAARADWADARRREAEGHVAGLEARLSAAYRNAHGLWAKGNALVDLTDTLTAELQRSRIEMAEIRVAQQQFFSEVRVRAEAHVDAVEEGLAFTGLDIDAMLLAMSQHGDSSGLGGPLIPALTGRPLNEAMWAEASDIVVLIDRAAALRDIANELPIGMPVRDSYRLSSGFGTRTDPFTGRVARHYGLDFAAPHGTPIHTTAPGRVVMAGWRGAYGYMVEIEHEFGLTTRYAHLSAVLVEDGDQVEYGDEVGLMGSTGRSSGPHLHYEVRVAGGPRNPIRFIRAGQNVFQAAD